MYIAKWGGAVLNYNSLSGAASWSAMPETPRRRGVVQASNPGGTAHAHTVGWLQYRRYDKQGNGGVHRGSRGCGSAPGYTRKHGTIRSGLTLAIMPSTGTGHLSLGSLAETLWLRSVSAERSAGTRMMAHDGYIHTAPSAPPGLQRIPCRICLPRTVPLIFVRTVLSVAMERRPGAASAGGPARE